MIRFDGLRYGQMALRLGVGTHGQALCRAGLCIAPDGAVERLTTPGFTLFDALAAIERREWALSINATNLLDKRYYASCSVRSACGTGYGRNVIATLRYRFE